MALTFELSEPTALAAGCSLVNFSINSGPKLALTVHKVSAIWLAPCRSIVTLILDADGPLSQSLVQVKFIHCMRRIGFVGLTGSS